MRIEIKGIDTIEKAAQEFISAIGENRVFAFYGQMGAGKTTFVKAICEALGVEDVITSPTFAIVNEYEIAEGEWAKKSPSVFHFDFYRIKSIAELQDMGFDDYIYSGNLCFMEWPELVEEALPDDIVRIKISVQADGTRVVESN